MRDVAALSKAGLAIKVLLKPINKNGKTWYTCYLEVESIRYQEGNKMTQLVTMRGATWMMFDLNRAVRQLENIFPNVATVELQLPRDQGVDEDTPDS